MLIVAAAGARWSVYSRDIGGIRWCVAHRSSTKSFLAAAWSEKFVRLDALFFWPEPEAARHRFGRRAKKYPRSRRSHLRLLKGGSAGAVILEESPGAPGAHGKVTA